MARARDGLGGRRNGGGAGWLLPIGAVLCAIGLALAVWQVAPTLVEWARARSWVPVEATLLSVDLDRSYGARRPTTHEVRARYRYAVDGRTYEADRVALDRGKDNVGDYQTRMHAWLEEQARRMRTVTAWVDPADPAQAILDRDMRWGLLAFKAVFAGVFLGVGSLFVLAALRPPPSVPSARARAKAERP